VAEIRVGIDIGGTFTDFVVFNSALGLIETFKLLSTPNDPAEAVLTGMQRLRDRLGGGSQFSLYMIHGSTVATNALLERKGAATALVTTRGFKDVLQIGRQNRPSLYDLAASPPPPLVPEERRFEVDERVDQRGQVLTPCDVSQVDRLIGQIKDTPASTIAVCTLFSFLYPHHEQLIADRLRQAGYFVSASSEILPEFREYERTSTTVVNAYVSPVLDRYLEHLETGLASNTIRLRVMQSNGGVISLPEARHNGVRCILSGPAGGIVGARYTAWNALCKSFSPHSTLEPEHLRLITFDMGGTSTDAALIDGEPKITTEASVSGCPIAIPMLDIHTIGAGGGSLARMDLGGALRVGPESAGADPGPACYGRGDQPTVTDANVYLGRLPADLFLGGEMPLDAPRAGLALEALGRSLGLEPVQAALGIVEVVNAHMERALRAISVERGYDPRDFTLLSFGGAGGLHAADLARRLGIWRVMVSPYASTLSAFGMLAANVVKDYSQTVMLPGEAGPEALQQALEPLVTRAVEDIAAEGIAEEAILIERLLDMRYHGQSYELTVPFGGDFVASFHEVHQHTYGYARKDAPIEIVNVRVRGTGIIAPPPLLALPAGGPDPLNAFLGLRSVTLHSEQQGVPFYRWELLKPGNRLSGPALVVRADTTILIDTLDTAEVDDFGNLLIQVGGQNG
jgi:N-methylhydantoinase A